MDLFNKHYEKLILVVCLILMILGLIKVSDIVGDANRDSGQDRRSNANKIDTHRGNMVDDFQPGDFKSKEGWIERIKAGTPSEVLSIARVMASSTPEAAAKEIRSMGDRRYFSILTRHSRKPIEETEANYRLEKNKKELGVLKKNMKDCEDKLKKHIEANGEKENDTRLAELKMQLDGYQKLQANIEMNISELEARVRYITLFCTEQGSMVDPHEVVCCTNPACGALILSKEDECPFCKTKMPEINPAEDDGKDSDGDGLPDDYEKAHAQRRGFLVSQEEPNRERNADGMGMGDRGGRDSGQKGVLDPYNANDAMEDFDGDSFTNLEEYRFGTDIDDEHSYPNPANYVRLVQFEQDKFPLKLMGINYGKAPREQKDTKWRARFSFLRKVRNREFWDASEDNWEQVRVGKKFDGPDGKTYILMELDEIEVDGKKVATAKVKEFIAPARPKRVKPGETAEPAPETKEAAVFSLKQEEETFFPTWYAQIVYLATRNLNAIDRVMNVRGRYMLRSGAKNIVMSTRFKLVEGEEFTLVVPIAKKDPAAETAEKKPPRRRRGRDDEMRGGDMDGMGRNGGMSSPEVEQVEHKYKVDKFSRDSNQLTIKSVVEGKEGETFTVGVYNEEETYTLPDRQSYPLLYQGGNGGERMGDDMMMDEGRPLRGGGPDRRMRR